MPQVLLRPDITLLAKIDAARGSRSRQLWIMDLIERELGTDAEVGQKSSLANVGSSKTGQAFVGCIHHPDAKAVSNRGEWWCGAEGCINHARPAA